MSYNPIPPRVWSRVQNPCTFIDPDDQYLSSYIPLTGQTVSQAQADYEMKQLYKGNILQYKGNSARFTKSQKYSQLARCSGPGRTKVFATQSEKYTNPNTTGLLRQNSVTYPFPNQIVGVPNNISGPFAYNIPNPNNCSGSSIQDGGTLVCGTYVNPCSGEIIKETNTSATICNPASASNVPGSAILCWNTKAQTWFPKQRYFMNNSTDKWPVNYKGFVSALTCTKAQPKLIFQGFDNNNINNITIRKSKSNGNSSINEFNDEFNFDDEINDELNEFNFDEDFKNIYKDLINGDKDIMDIGIMDTDIMDTDLLNTELLKTELLNADLINDDLMNTDLMNTDLMNTGLMNTDLMNTDLMNTDLMNTQNISRDVITYNINIDLKPNSIFKVDSFNIYIDGKFYENVVNNNTYNHTITIINKLNCSINITTVTNGVESAASESIFVNYTPVDRSPLPPVEIYKCELIDICKKIDEKFLILNTSIANVFQSTETISDSLKEFQILKSLLSSDAVINIGTFVQKYIAAMYEESAEYLPYDIYNALKDQLTDLDELLKTDPDAIVNQSLTTKNVNMLLNSKSKNNIIQQTSKAEFLSPESTKSGQQFLDNYKKILSLMRSAFEKKLTARSAVLDSLDWKKDSEILNNAMKLKEYVEDLNKTVSLFKLGIQPIPIELKQQYVIYHTLYGIPKNLEYDPKLMGPILENLGITVNYELGILK